MCSALVGWDAERARGFDMDHASLRTGSIPASAADLTPQWLSAVLSASTGDDSLQISHVDVQPVGVGVGIMSVLYRLTPTYSAGNGPKSVIAKLAPPYPQVREIAAGYHFYDREVSVYQQLGSELAFRPPHVHLARHDPSTDDFVIVLEDFGGLRTADQLDGCSITDARNVLLELARLHARWWEDPRFEQLPFLQSWADPPFPEYHGQAAKQTWPVTRIRFEHVIPERIAKLGERWPDIGPALMEDMPNHPRTLCHGDVRLDNLFFHDDGGPPVSIVDWQIAGRSTGAGDVAYFMSQSLTVDDRRAHQDELTKLYYDALIEGGVRDYSFDEFWNDYRTTTLFCLCYPLQAGAVELVNDRAVALATAMLERSISAIIDLDADECAP